ncbi:HNH endonuclease signature motif containing protein, partial [Nocardia sp. CDC160]|uniref:HNH endonuclease signature motif containing protein n=1 Tax=Nocardia sp. CDC160 TaxID=3112166 RepID=UPI002DBAC0CA
MNSKGETLDSTGISALMTVVTNVTDNVLHGGLNHLSDIDVVEFMRRLEICKRQLAALDSALVIEVSDRDLPRKAGVKDAVPFLRQTLGLSRYDAAVRVKIAAACGEFLGADGKPRPVALAATANAFETGVISRDHVRGIVDIMTHLPADVPAPARVETEALLVEHCVTGMPDDLPKIGREILARLDPEGTVISDADRRRRRGITISRPGVDGMSKIEGWLTPELRALLDAIFAKLARPGMCNLDDAEAEILAATARVDSKVLEAAARRDRRDAAQRTHDALFALVTALQPVTDTDAAAAKAGKPVKLGKHRGLPVEVVVTMSLADLERGAGVATTASGGHLSINEALKLAKGSRPVLAVLDKDEIPLYLAHGERLASAGQRLALIARDRGCTHPGCDVPASMCAAHHVIDWAKGGPTDLNNLALVCDHHHALVNDSDNGWQTVMLGKDSAHP